MRTKLDHNKDHDGILIRAKYESRTNSAILQAEK